MNPFFRILLSSLLISLLLIGVFFIPAQGQIKPESMVVPVAFTGIEDSNVKQIIQDHVLTELSQFFELKTEKEIAIASERAADKISSQDCSEISCLKIMGELLDVDYIFSIKVNNTF